jgi:hypothetical protein
MVNDAFFCFVIDRGGPGGRSLILPAQYEGQVVEGLFHGYLSQQG